MDSLWYEKWVTYDKISRKRSWSKRREAALIFNDPREASRPLFVAHCLIVQNMVAKICLPILWLQKSLSSKL